jgi:hypothetical protein
MGPKGAPDVFRHQDELADRPSVSKSTSSRKRRRKRNSVPGGYNWATMFLGDINTGTWPSRLEQTRTTVANYSPALSSEMAPHVKKPGTDSNKKLVMYPPYPCLTPREIDRLTAGRNVHFEASESSHC